MLFLHPATTPWDLAIVGLLGSSLLFAIVCCLWLRRHRTSNRVTRLLVGFFGFLGIVGFLLVVYGSFIEPQMLVVTREEIALWGATGPLRIAVISDLHVGPYKGRDFVEQVVKKANAEAPDIVILTGDYFFTDFSDPSELEPLAGLRSTLGTFAVLGNHDSAGSRALQAMMQEQHNRTEEVRELFRRLSITVLENRNRTLQTSAGPVAIAGIADVWTGHADLAAALAGVAPGTPIILAAHSPDVILDPRSRDAHLIIAGHTHGGQIRLPFIGPLAPIPTRVGQRYDQGLFRLDNDTTLAITRGVGESSPRARLFAWPEIMILEIHP